MKMIKIFLFDQGVVYLKKNQNKMLLKEPQFIIELASE